MSDWIKSRLGEASTKRALLLLPFAAAALYFSVFERNTQLATEVLAIGATAKALIGAIQSDNGGTDG